MGITEEQRRRAEANRLAALEKRKRFAEAAAAAAAATASTSYTTVFPASGTPAFPAYDAAAEWRLAKCPRIAPPAPQHRSALLPPASFSTAAAANSASAAGGVQGGS